MRKSAQTNLHPNICSRSRQIWYLVFNYLKYLKPGSRFSEDSEFVFQGEDSVVYHSYSPLNPKSRMIHDNVPKSIQSTTIIARGMICVFGHLFWVWHSDTNFQFQETRLWYMKAAIIQAIVF